MGDVNMHELMKQEGRVCARDTSPPVINNQTENFSKLEEEAERAIEQAEESFEAGDLPSANLLASKTQSLLPSHPHTDCPLAAPLIHIDAAAASASALSNQSAAYWRAVLGVEPTEDLKAVEKQFEKMCLLIHPDKNPSAASEGAFELVSRAWEALSNSLNDNDDHGSSTSSAQNDESIHPASDDWANEEHPSDDESEGSSTYLMPQNASSHTSDDDELMKQGKEKKSVHVQEEEEEKEAERAIKQAEESFKADDLAAANCFASMAKSLHPSHPHIDRLLAALFVHTAAAALASVSSNQSAAYWRTILGAKPTDDLKAVEKQFEKMCLLTHPDKNPSAASEGAFELVSRAWEALSNSHDDNIEKGYSTSSAHNDESFHPASDDWANEEHPSDDECGGSSTYSDDDNELMKQGREKKSVHVQEEEEAERAIEQAEESFNANDLAAANHFASKAKSLHRTHPHIDRLLAALLVHTAAAASASASSTQSTAYWHTILGSKPTDDLEEIKKQFKKMCLLTHPDKNPSAVAEGAFKLVSCAWEALSCSSAKKGSSFSTSSDDGKSEEHNSDAKCSGSSTPSAHKDASFHASDEDDGRAKGKHASDANSNGAVSILRHESSDAEDRSRSSATNHSFDFSSAFERRFQEGSLEHIVFSWSLEDVFNRNLGYSFEISMLVKNRILLLQPAISESIQTQQADNA